MKELNDQELEQVQGGTSVAGGLAAGAAGAFYGVGADSSNVYAHTTPYSGTADASNRGFAAGVDPIVLSGAAAGSATGH
jgi:lactobin A/cerein 7B family class IIb bacteriocin